ncbi:MAG: hypothetical protein ABIC40_05485, partial [bacterium]
MSEQISGNLARVVPLSGVGRIGRSLTYRIPESISNSVEIGSVVAVQVRETVRIGVVIGFEEPDDILKVLPFELKEILSVYDDETLLRAEDVESARWIAAYYLCGMSDALAPFTPEVRALQPVKILIAENPDIFFHEMETMGLLF